MDNTIVYLAAFAAVVAVAVACAIIAVRRDGRGMDRLIKQLLIWVAIAALLPLSSWSGATMIHPRTEWKELTSQRARVQQETYGGNEGAETRARVRDELMRLDKLIEEENRRFYRAMFWISYPVGMVALVVGLLLRHVIVGTALAFGGLCTLTAGCYSYWNDMDDGLRFFSLLIVLAILIGIGLLKFGRPAPATGTT